VLAAEGLTADDDAVQLIARSADGGMRDGLSILDQVLSFGEGPVTAQRVRDVLGLIPDEMYGELLRLVAERDGRQGAQDCRPPPLLKTEYDGEQPAHTRVETVVCAQADQRQPGPHLRWDHDGKQYESDDASPPPRWIWWGRSPSKGTKKSGSMRRPPSGAASSLAAQPRMPSG